MQWKQRAEDLIAHGEDVTWEQQNKCSKCIIDHGEKTVQCNLGQLIYDYWNAQYLVSGTSSAGEQTCGGGGLEMVLAPEDDDEDAGEGSSQEYIVDRILDHTFSKNQGGEAQLFCSKCVQFFPIHESPTCQRDHPRKIGTMQNHVLSHTFMKDALKIKFLIQWRDYALTDNTWEPESVCGNAPTKLKDYWRAYAINHKGKKVGDEEMACIRKHGLEDLLCTEDA